MEEIIGKSKIDILSSLLLQDLSIHIFLLSREVGYRGDVIKLICASRIHNVSSVLSLFKKLLYNLEIVSRNRVCLYVVEALEGRKLR